MGTDGRGADRQSRTDRRPGRHSQRPRQRQTDRQSATDEKTRTLRKRWQEFKNTQPRDVPGSYVEKKKETKKKRGSGRGVICAFDLANKGNNHDPWTELPSAADNCLACCMQVSGESCPLLPLSIVYPCLSQRHSPHSLYPRPVLGWNGSSV